MTRVLVALVSSSCESHIIGIETGAFGSMFRGETLTTPQ